LPRSGTSGIKSDVASGLALKAATRKGLSEFPGERGGRLEGKIAAIMRRNSSHNKTPLLKQPPGSRVTCALAGASSLHSQGGAAHRHVCAIHRFP